MHGQPHIKITNLCIQCSSDNLYITLPSIVLTCVTRDIIKKIPVGTRFSALPLYNGYRVFPVGKERQDHAADHSPSSSAAVMEEYSYTVILRLTSEPANEFLG